MKTAKEILKYKQNSLNHLIHFPLKGSNQIEGTYIHTSAIYEAMEEYASQFTSTPTTPNKITNLIKKEDDCKGINARIIKN